MKNYMISNLWDIYDDKIPSYILDGMECNAVKRLRYVGMNCGMNYTSFPFYGDMEPYSRFEHSIGTALIINHFSGDIKQAFSGLFHDLTTPAFAHVIDFMNQDHILQESTEIGIDVLIQKSPDIRKLLDKYHLNIEEVSDYHMYPIADNDSPKLSADRLEYTLGCLFHYHLCTKDELSHFYQDLRVSENEEGIEELCFLNDSCAEEFALASLKCSYIFTEDEDRYGMEVLARLLKHAIDCRIITKNDLMVDEPYVIHKLESSHLRDEWKAFTELKKIIVKKHPFEGGLCVSAKKRYIDPFVINRGRLSRISERFQLEREMFLKKSFDVYMCNAEE